MGRTGKRQVGAFSRYQEAQSQEELLIHLRLRRAQRRLEAQTKLKAQAEDYDFAAGCKHKHQKAAVRGNSSLKHPGNNQKAEVFSFSKGTKLR